MPDITMCCNEECPDKLKCYRHEAKPSIRQSMAEFKFKYTGSSTIVCDNYWPMKLEINYEDGR